MGCEADEHPRTDVRQGFVQHHPATEFGRAARVLERRAELTRVLVEFREQVVREATTRKHDAKKREVALYSLSLSGVQCKRWKGDGVIYRRFPMSSSDD